MIRIFLLIGLIGLSFSSVAADSDVCKSAASTIELNRCAEAKLDVVKQEMTHYLNVSLQANVQDTMLTKSMKKSQADWQHYVSSYCDTIYIQWRAGTIRGLKSIACEKRLTKQRTHEIWSSFLVTNDNALLPEPK